MARMYPRTLLEDEVESDGEKRVFAVLRDGLPDEWEAYHSASWMLRDPAEGALDGEIDFVLCHPDEAILCLEVKGGGIECRHGEWFRLIDGKRKRAEDPFKQALDHRYDLERLLDGVDGIRARGLFLVHGLAFPDITVHELVLAPDAPPEIVIDRNDLKEIEESIERVLAYHRGAREKRKPPGEKGADALRDLLAPEVRIEVPMASEFLDEEEALITLTHDQAMLLNRFGRDPRMVITGCAGSGKTMLAVEQAKRLARKGKDVLFVCFNRALRDHLRAREAKSGVEFQSFHALCVQLASQAGVELPEHPEDDTPPEFLDEELPNALVEAIEELGPQYDALFVDEAQDLENHWLDALMLTLRDPDEDLVWLFMDANQQVYEARLDVPKEFRPFDLTVNCRNTQAIAREVLKKYEGEIEPEVIGPPGPRGRADPDRRPGRGGRRRRPATLRQGGGPAAGRRRPLLAQPRPLRGRPGGAAGPLLLRQGPRPARPQDPLLLDPRLQGPRVAGRHPLRARGPRRRDDRPAALRRHLTGAQPLRDRGAGGPMSQRRGIRGFVRRVARLPGNSRVRRNEPAATPTAVSPNRAAAPAADAKTTDALPRLVATDFFGYLRPSQCGLRVWLRHAGVEETPPGPFAKVLMSLGREHERRHLERFPEACDLGGLPIAERVERTREEVTAGERVVYQGALRACTRLADTEVEIVGVPDFLLPARRGYAIRDSKLAHRVDGHPEIELQLALYGWLYEQTFDQPPVAVQVHTGLGTIEDVPYEGGAPALAALEEIIRLRNREDPPHEVVGWSKCSGCGYFERCWPEAVEQRSIGLLPWVDRGLIGELDSQGVQTIDDLLERLRRRLPRRARAPLGQATQEGRSRGRADPRQRPGACREPADRPRSHPRFPSTRTTSCSTSRASRRASMSSRRSTSGACRCSESDRPRSAPPPPASAPRATAKAGRPFSTRRRRSSPSTETSRSSTGQPTSGPRSTSTWAATAIATGSRPESRRTFSTSCRSPTTPWPYRRRATASSRSRAFAGFERQITDAGGDWSMARYIEATETSDQRLRASIMDEILDYNREDLEATWAVLDWLARLEGNQPTSGP